MDRKEFENWLRKQSQETCVKIATRAALRVFPIVTHIDQPNDEQFQLALLTARAILTAGVASTLPSININAAAGLAANAADSAASTALNASANAAISAAFAAAEVHIVVESTYGATYAASNAAANATNASYIAANAASTAADTDMTIEQNDLFRTPIWHEPREPEWLVSALKPTSNLLESGHDWSFWREWYHGFLIGAPLNWELQKEIALIPNKDWEKGPEWIAGLIGEIRKEYPAKTWHDKSRQPDFEPSSVARLFANKELVVTGTSGLAVEIGSSIERFCAESGANKIPEPFQSLQAIPGSLVKISAILFHEVQSTGSEQKLREEIGRLNAKIAELENALLLATQSTEPVFTPALKKQVGTSLGDWKLYAALAAGLWVISGDDVGMQKRLKNVVELRQKLLGDVCPQPDPRTINPSFPLA